MQVSKNVFYDHDIFCVCFDVMYGGEYNEFFYHRRTGTLFFWGAGLNLPE